MRPRETARDSRFECYGCGYRAEENPIRRCPVCGNRLRNIGAPRDL